MKPPMEKEIDNYVNKKNDKPYLVNMLLNIFDKMSPESPFFVGGFKRLPLFFYYLGGFVYNGGWFAVFAYFIYSSYETYSTSSYVSLDNISGVCTEVPIAITGEYKLDNYGTWETQHSFKPQYASMIARTSAFDSDSQTYSKLINKFGERYYNISKKSMYRDLAYNLNVLASAYTIDTSSGILELQPTGEISYMLNKQYSLISAVVNISDLLGTNPGCFRSGTNLDISTNLLTSSFSYSKSSYNCKRIAFDFGYDSTYGDIFYFKLDLASFSTTVAVNNFILDITDLNSIGPYAYRYDSQDDPVDDEPIVRNRRKLEDIEKKKQISKINLNYRDFNSYVNLELQLNETLRELEPAANILYQVKLTSSKFMYTSAYPGMEPILCLIFDHDDKKSLCFMFKYVPITLSYIYMYPVMKHYHGTNCKDDSVWGSKWYDHISEILQNSSWTAMDEHNVDILLGIVVFENLIDLTAFAYETYSILTSSEDGDLIVSNRFYTPMRIMIDVYYKQGNISNYPSQDILCGKNYLNNPVTTIDCYMITMNQFGEDYYTNADHFQLFAGACRNSIYHKSAFKKAAANPPTKLIQPYYSCKYTTFDIVFNSLGLSLGNTYLYITIGWVIFCFILTVILWYFFGFDPKMHIYPPLPEEEEEKVNIERSNKEDEEVVDDCDTNKKEFKLVSTTLDIEDMKKY